jgi:hypothetical protein
MIICTCVCARTMEMNGECWCVLYKSATRHLRLTLMTDADWLTRRRAARDAPSNQPKGERHKLLQFPCRIARYELKRGASQRHSGSSSNYRHYLAAISVQHFQVNFGPCRQSHFRRVAPQFLITNIAVQYFPSVQCQR